MVSRRIEDSLKITTWTKVVYFKYDLIAFIYDYVSVSCILKYNMLRKIYVIRRLFMNLWIFDYFTREYIKN